jgi:DNA-binding NarL/FixJ family response regulator
VANPAYPEALGAALRGAIADPDLLPAQKRAVLDMTLKGWSDLEIAAALRVDERTVRSHRSKAAALLRGHLT